MDQLREEDLYIDYGHLASVKNLFYAYSEVEFEQIIVVLENNISLIVGGWMQVNYHLGIAYRGIPDQCTSDTRKQEKHFG